MTLPLTVTARMAWRNLWRNHRRTIIMLLAIAIGVWAMIFMIALMRGMVDEMVLDGIRTLPGHVQIHHPQYRDDPSIVNSFTPPDEQLLAVLNSDQVSAWSSIVRVPAMISSERDNRGVVLLGVDPKDGLAVGFDPDDIVEGRFLNGSGDRGIVIGKKLAERLETQLGKRVVVMSQNPDNDIVDRGFRVIGIYQATLQALEETNVYAGRETLQTLLQLDDQVSETAVFGFDYRNVDDLVEAVRLAAPPDLETLPWTQLNEYLSLMMVAMDGFVLVWMVVVFLALSFGLVNTLMMAVFERVREFGLMQALGMQPSAIIWQVLIESLLLLAIGLAVGNLLAIGSILPLRDGIDISMVSEGMEMFGAASVLYPAIKWPDLLLANVVVMVLGLITSLLPAWRASQYEPVEAIAKT
jgi:ABC-type lipoprotein release transport system permease subunit